MAVIDELEVVDIHQDDGNFVVARHAYDLVIEDSVQVPSIHEPRQLVCCREHLQLRIEPQHFQLSRLRSVISRETPVNAVGSAPVALDAAAGKQPETFLSVRLRRNSTA